MQQKMFRLIMCGILLGIAACAPQPSPTLAPTITVQESTSTPTIPKPTAISPDLISSIDTLLTNLVDNNLLTGSVLIGQQGTILFSKGYGLADRENDTANTVTTRFRLGSITKQFTAMAILMLEAQGKLKVSDPICNYLADCPSTWNAITIHHLLTHTSGITEYLSLAEVTTTIATPSAPDQIIARFSNLPLDFQPGERWSYSNSGYVVLGYIIEQVSGRTYEDFLQQSIFIPLNLQNTGYDHNSNGLAVGYKDRYSHPATFIDMSIPFSAGALYSSVEDLYTWEKALSTEQLVPKNYLDKMFTHQVDIPDSNGWGYGYGWIIATEFDRPVFYHGGLVHGFSTIVTRYVDDDIVIIVLSNQESQDVGLIEETIAKKLFGVQ